MVALSPTITSDVATTITSHLATTLFATQGQTLTITSPNAPLPENPNTEYTSTTITESTTVTLTELDIYLQNTQGVVYSTWIIPLPLAPTNSETPNPSVYVVQPGRESDGDEVWDNWTKGERAGLIVGVILAAALIFGITWWCCMRRNNVWLAHGWWPWMGQGMTAHISPAPPAMNVVQPTYVNGPLMPYAHGQPNMNTNIYGRQH